MKKWQRAEGRSETPVIPAACPPPGFFPTPSATRPYNSRLDDQFVVDGQLPPDTGLQGFQRTNRIHVVGECAEDVTLSSETVARLVAPGIVLEHPPTGRCLLIRTDGSVQPGAKVNALDPLDEAFGPPFAGNEEAGGGASRAALGLAQHLRSLGLAGDVRLVVSGEACPSLTARCSRLGVHVHGVGRHPCPRNLVIPWGNDRVIVRQKVAARADGLSAQEVVGLARFLGGQPAVVSVVSPKDGAVVSAALGSAQAAFGYLQPTGSLNWPHTAALLADADCLVCNFGELCSLGQSAGLATPGHFTEESPGAAEHAVSVLRGLHHRGQAGKEAAACTMGRGGSVVADWRRGQIWQIVLEIIDEDRGAGVPTVAGCGDLWLGFLIASRAWASSGHLRHPEAAAAVRATVAVARRLGLRPDQYDVRSVPLKF